MSLLGTQIYNDRDLLRFKTYEEYLNSLVTPADLSYLESEKIARQLVQLGYRSLGETLSKSAFYRRLEAARNLVFPIYKPYILCSELIPPTDSLRMELALRERENRLGLVSTIIFLRYCTSETQFEISGYIDYAHRLETQDWLPFFRGEKKLRVRITDLGYYHWKKKRAVLNTTSNYEPIVDSKRGLIFKNSRDRNIIQITSNGRFCGTGTSRKTVNSEGYENVVLYDHLVRSKL